jgi:hypothetical protein
VGGLLYVLFLEYLHQTIIGIYGRGLPVVKLFLKGLRTFKSIKVVSIEEVVIWNLWWPEVLDHVGVVTTPALLQLTRIAMF